MYAQIKLWQNVVGVLHYSVWNCHWNESMELRAERELSCDEPKGACLNSSRKPFPKHLARFQGASCSSWDQIRISALSKNFIALNLRVGWDTPKESLQELAEDLDCLVRLAYPCAPEEMKDLQFIDTILDGDASLPLKKSRPQSLQAALTLAMEQESYWLASLQGEFQLMSLVAGNPNRMMYSTCTS